MDSRFSKPGVIDAIVRILRNAYPCGISFTNAKAQLATKFPGRDAESMLCTLQQQVPSKLRSEKGINVVRGTKDGWCIAPLESIRSIEK